MSRRISPPPRKEFSDPFLSLSSYHRFSTRKYVLGMFPACPCDELLHPNVAISKLGGDLGQRHALDVPQIRHLHLDSFTLRHVLFNHLSRLLFLLQNHAI